MFFCSYTFKLNFQARCSEVQLFLQDIEICCRDCRTKFLFTVAEQEFFALKKLGGHPRRCQRCRELVACQHRLSYPAVLTKTTCSRCAQRTLSMADSKGTGLKVCFHCLFKQRYADEAELLMN